MGVPQFTIWGPQRSPFVPGRLEARACPPGGSRLLYTAVPCPADSSFLLFCRTAISHYFNPAVSAGFSESDGAFFVGPGHWGKPGGHQCLPQWLGSLKEFILILLQEYSLSINPRCGKNIY